MGPEDLVRAVASGDKAAVSRANGVGAKLAGRIVSELKDRAGGIALGPSATMAGGGGQPGEAVDADAVSALVNLGYGRSEAFGAVARAGNRLGGEAALADLIRGGLEELSQ
jgi:Holliday junction DNA helicase RuvA